MAYQEYAVASIDDIIARIVDFTTPLGFHVSSTATSVVLRTSSDTGVRYTLSKRPPAADSERFLDVTTTGLPTPLDFSLRAPRVGGAAVGSFVDLTPTKMFAISLSDPEPYMVFVIEYGYNNVRHLYIGNMNKAGTYGGGEVIDVTGFRSTMTTGQTATIAGRLLTTNRTMFRGLFSGNADLTTFPLDRRGGVHLESPSMPTGPRFNVATVSNYNANSWTLASAALNGVGGGYADGLNDPTVVASVNRAENYAALIPINLFLPRNIQGTPRMYAIGNPVGVRMFNMLDAEPYTTFTVGSQTWHGFPAVRRNPTPELYSNATSTTTQGYILEENSYLLGYAYRSQ